MNQSLVFRTEKVTERITRIYAFATELMYLVEGTEKAVLIDTGSGIGSLKACVEQLTDKPVVVLVTHGHVDHAMGAAEFDPFPSPWERRTLSYFPPTFSRRALSDSSYSVMVVE